MTERTYIAVDSGASGGIAWSNRLGVHVVPMPDTRRGVIDVINDITIDDQGQKPPVAYYEKIQGFIPDGGPSMMFNFGIAYERVACVLETRGIRIVEVTPQHWIKALGLGKKGMIRAEKGATAAEKQAVKKANAEAKRDWKNKLKAEAERRFPGLKVTLKTADALLLLEVAIRTEAESFL